ncbi:MAG: thioesterase superfamily protein [Frankiales bacterium]|nr:thioesterase superfamily protein [Frankiales bacterium]
MTEPTALTPGADVLADAVRRLVDATVRTTATDLEAAARAVDAITDSLSTHLREGPWRPNPAHPEPSPYNTVMGQGNPFAAPVVMTSAGPEGVTGMVCFGTVYEGAPGLVHGGILSLVFDQLLGEAAIAAKVPGMTVGLEIRYAAPTPLQTELLLAAHVEESGDRTVRLVGSIVADGVTTATATGTFFRLTEAHARRIFPHLARE